MVLIENLNKSFWVDNREFKVLKNINLHIKKGEVAILKGVSGSGKSTLLSIIAGLDKPTSGKVLIDGEPISKLPDIHLSYYRAKKIGIVFQDFNLIEDLTLLDNVLSPTIPLRLKLKEAKEKAITALKRANIDSKAFKVAKDLSGGEKQRGAIARAIVNSPNLIICDEPTANLDLKNSLNFLNIIKELNSEGKTVLIATHDPIFEKLDIEFKIYNLSDGIIE